MLTWFFLPPFVVSSFYFTELARLCLLHDVRWVDRDSILEIKHGWIKVSKFSRNLLTYVSDVCVVYAKSWRRSSAGKKGFIASFDLSRNLRPSMSYKLMLVMNVSSRFLAPIPAIFLRDIYCLDNLCNKFKKINEIIKQVKSNGNEVNRTGILRILKYGTDDINS